MITSSASYGCPPLEREILFWFPPSPLEAACATSSMSLTIVFKRLICISPSNLDSFVSGKYLISIKQLFSRDWYVSPSNLGSYVSWMTDIKCSSFGYSINTYIIMECLNKLIKSEWPKIDNICKGNCKPPKLAWKLRSTVREHTMFHK